MTSIRGARAADGRYVMLRNEALQDERLSLEARGVLCLVLSLPPDHHFTKEWLVERVSGRNGRRSVGNALDELEKFGYFRKDRVNAEGGRYRWDQVITDDPTLLPPPARESDRNRQLLASIPSDRIRSDGVSSENTMSSQVAPYDRKPSDGKRSDKRQRREDLNKKDGAGSLSPSGAVQDGHASEQRERDIARGAQDQTGGALSLPVHARQLRARLNGAGITLGDAATIAMADVLLSQARGTFVGYLRAFPDEDLKALADEYREIAAGPLPGNGPTGLHEYEEDPETRACVCGRQKVDRIHPKRPA